MAESDNLGPRGSHIWSALSWEGIAPPESTYLVELCRMADTLDTMDALIRSGNTDVLTERRLTQSAFRQYVGEWRRMTTGSGSHTVGPQESEGPTDDDFLDELSARRAERLANAQGGELPAL